MHPILNMLSGGDLRSIGRSNEVVALVLNEPSLVVALIEGLIVNDPVIRMRSADALEKVSAANPESITQFKEILFQSAATAVQKEVQWHLAQILPRLPLTHPERKGATKILLGYLSSNSSIVKTSVMQALAEFAKDDSQLRPSLIRRIRILSENGTPAMRARGRKLLDK